MAQAAVDQCQLVLDADLGPVVGHQVTVEKYEGDDVDYGVGQHKSTSQITGSRKSPVIFFSTARCAPARWNDGPARPAPPRCPATSHPKATAASRRSGGGVVLPHPAHQLVKNIEPVKTKGQHRPAQRRPEVEYVVGVRALLPGPEEPFRGRRRGQVRRRWASGGPVPCAGPVPAPGPGCRGRGLPGPAACPGPAAWPGPDRAQARCRLGAAGRPGASAGPAKAEARYRSSAPHHGAEVQRRAATTTRAPPTKTKTTGSGHHQWSQRAPTPWVLSRPHQNTPSTTSTAPTAAPMRLTPEGYPARDGYVCGCGRA